MNNQLKETKFYSIESSLVYDIVYLFVFPPISLISLVANLLAYRILSSRFFKKKPIYNYLKVCCLNSSVSNFIYALSFICETRLLLPQVANTAFANYFRCYFKIPVNNTCYFYGSVLDIVLAVDRLVEFTPMKTKFRRMNPKRVCTVLFLVCLTINVPFFFSVEPRESVELVVTNISGELRNQTKIYYFYSETRFATSREGRIFLDVQYFVRDIITLVILVSINLTSLVLFWREYKINNKENKHESFQCRSSDLSRSGMSDRMKSNQKNSDLDRNNSHGNSAGGVMVEEGLLANKQREKRSSVEVLQINLSRRNLEMNVVQARTMLTKVIFIICLFAILQHLFVAFSIKLFKSNQLDLFMTMFFFTSVSVCAKHSINFWIIYYFNVFFQKRVNSLVSKCFRCK